MQKTVSMEKNIKMWVSLFTLLTGIGLTISSVHTGLVDLQNKQRGGGVAGEGAAKKSPRCGEPKHKEKSI